MRRAAAAAASASSSTAGQRAWPPARHRGAPSLCWTRKDAAIHVCHAGIQYASAPVSVNEQRFGLVTAGQFLTEAPDPDAFRERALATGARIGVSGEQLAEAMDSIKIVSHENALQITALLQTIANAISSIGYQGYQARQTLAQIAQLTARARER